MKSRLIFLSLTVLFAVSSKSDGQTPSGQRPGTATVQQVRPQIARKLIRFSGKAATAANLKLTPAQMKAIPSRKAPAPLSATALQQALDGKVGTPYATVKVARLIEPNKAEAQAWTPTLVNSLTLANGVPRMVFEAVEYQNPSGYFHPSLFVTINSPAAGNFYLIDCSVSVATYTVEGPGGTQTTQVQNGHLMFHLDQAAQGWNYFTIRSDEQWEFYSCSILQQN